MDPLFKVFAGAPYDNTRAVDLGSLQEAFKLIPPDFRYRGSRADVPIGVIHPEVIDNPDDGYSRNCLVLNHLHVLGKEDRMRIRAALTKTSYGVCSYCDRGFYQRFDCDHVWPAQHGGISGLQNFVASCRQCNTAAGAARTCTIWHRRAYVRLMRGCLLPDTNATLHAAAARLQHLHTDLL
jgi:5-methylcytosine-specific restriction endonuclease McrA